MSTFNEIAYNILNINRDGQTSADEPIQKEQVIFMVNYYRSLLVKKQGDKKRSLDINLVQDLGCVPVIKVDKAECCDIVTNCTIYRTKNQIPSPAGGDTDMFTYIGGINKHTPFNLIAKSRSVWVQYSKYAKKAVYAYYINGYVYIENYPYDLKEINIQGVFDDPMEAINFIDCDENGNCELGFDAEYPIAGWMLQTITEAIMKQELTFMAGRIIDNTNNFKSIQTIDGK